MRTGLRSGAAAIMVFFWLPALRWRKVRSQHGYSWLNSGRTMARRINDCMMRFLHPSQFIESREVNKPAVAAISGNTSRCHAWLGVNSRQINSLWASSYGGRSRNTATPKGIIFAALHLVSELPHKDRRQSAGKDMLGTTSAIFGIRNRRRWLPCEIMSGLTPSAVFPHATVSSRPGNKQTYFQP